MQEIDPPIPASPRCDFCSSPDPIWRYQTVSFDKPEAKWRSVGDWAACEACYKLIQASQWEVLAQRAWNTMPRQIRQAIEFQGALAVQIIKAEIRRLHQEFRANRTPLEPERID